MSEFAHIHGHRRTVLSHEVVQRIDALGLMRPMSREAIRIEVDLLFGSYVEVLATGEVTELLSRTQQLFDHLALAGVKAPDILGILLVVRDVLSRAVLNRYATEMPLLHRTLDFFEIATNRITQMAATGFGPARDQQRIAQQHAFRELSTPVLLLRERLLIVPIVGVVFPSRARQLTDQLLVAVRSHRARVVVIDVTGMATVDQEIAGHLMRTVEAARLMGAAVIVSGLSPTIAQAIVDLGSDISRLRTVGDLRSGVEEAELMLSQLSREMGSASPALLS